MTRQKHAYHQLQETATTYAQRFYGAGAVGRVGYHTLTQQWSVTILKLDGELAEVWQFATWEAAIDRLHNQVHSDPQLKLL